MSYLLKRLPKESGFSYLETLIALAVLGMISVVFLSGVSLTSKTAYEYDVRETATSLAQQQLEYIKDADYVYEATQYSTLPIPDTEDYVGFSVAVAAEPLHTPDDGIQKISITVSRYAIEVMKLETYKVYR